VGSLRSIYTELSVSQGILEDLDALPNEVS
jgi:hypothetical protein